MIEVGISAIANQSLTIQIDDRIYIVGLREANGCMSASITRDNVPLISNVRITPGTPLLPYLYQEYGNFIMTTVGEALPYWDQFGVSQFLLYVTPAELEAYRG